MKRIVAWVLVVTLIAGISTTSSFAQVSATKGRGGLLGFIAGCCFGIRCAAAYNDGKEIHWREWCRLLPYINIVFAIWDGIDGANGVTSSELVQRYGVAFY